MVLGLGMALSCGPAQGANGHRLAVSATILARIACRFTNDAPGQSALSSAERTPAAAASTSVNTLSRCTSSDAAASYRVRSNGGTDTLVVTVEP
jgi:hypothetical protein